MSLRLLLILTTVTVALVFTTPVKAAPLAQTTTEEATVDEITVEEVVVTSTTAFTLTVRIDEVTTVDIPIQVDWRAEGPVAGSEDEVLVAITPSVLRTGFFSVTVASVEPATGALAISLVQPAAETAPITSTTATTATGTTTTTVTTPPGAPTANGPTANAVSNLRAGPSTDYPIVGSAAAGDALEIVGQSSDGTWFVLANDAWIAAFLVANAPTGLPVVEAPALTLPSPTPNPAATDILTPTATPAP